MAAEIDANRTATLLKEADPVIRGAIRKKLRVSLRVNDTREANLDGMDLLGEIQLKLLTRTRQDTPQELTRIAEFKAYAATVAYHCCADYLRAKYPRRTSLKNCLRRLLEKVDGYSAWTDFNGELLCGFAGWTSRSAAAAERIRDIQQRPEVLPQKSIPQGSVESISGRDWLRLLEAVFEVADGPVAMDDLLLIVGPLVGLEDVPMYDDAGRDEEDGPAYFDMDNLATGAADPYSVRLTVERLKLYWGAVLQLLPWHRASYLLNLRDGDLGALPYYGVASIEAIGKAINLAETQLAILEEEVGLGVAPGKRFEVRFLACWEFLPLEDTVIALVLGVNRAQIIGYRNKAKERLARSLKGVL